MQEVSSAPDTSPVVLAENKRWANGNLIDANGYSATVVCSYSPSNSVRYIEHSGIYFQVNIFKDGQYIDYWSLASPRLNANSNGIATTLLSSEIEDAYIYIRETGDIIFAGKNTQYYGHTNVSELS